MPQDPPLQELVDRLVPDGWRSTHDFASDFKPCHQSLIESTLDDVRSKALDEWLASNQPCLFGQEAAKRGRIEYCFLTQADLIRGDDHVGGRIAGARLRWRCRGRKGETSAFIISVVSDLVARAEPNGALLDVAQRIVELYLCRDVPADRTVHDELFLEAAESRSWKVGVNFFGAQGDGRWWKDHRIPGGIAFSMNSVGHFACVRRLAKGDAEREQAHGLDRALLVAMQLINRTTEGVSGRNTRLHECAQHPEPAGVQCPVELPKALAGKNRCEYAGLYHTDHTLPSAYFVPVEFRPEGPVIDNLDLTYLFHDSPDNPDYRAMGLGLSQES